MRVGVVGTGVMGKSIAAYLSCFDVVDSVLIIGSRESKAELEMADLGRVIRRIARKCPACGLQSLEKVFPVRSLGQLSDADLIIEAVTEDYSIKKDIFIALDGIADDTVIIASNTSSISITRLASNLRFPSRVLGLHFFNPIEVMELVEVVCGFHTSLDVVAHSKTILADLHKKPVIINETPAFIVNRMLIPMINEAITLLSEGSASREDIDMAMKYGAHHPIGPLTLSDLIGNDVVLSIMQNLYEETNDSKYRPHPLLKKMVRAGALGRKVKSGFYRY